MKSFLSLIIFAAIASCSTTKNKEATTTILNGDTLVVHTEKLPGCISAMVKNFRDEDVQNPPRRVFSYLYEGKTVYYVTAPCCDQYSLVYDENCTELGAPDGGFTGRGDGKLPDFHDKATDRKLVWADKRKR